MCCISDQNGPQGERFITVDAATAERMRHRSTAQVPMIRHRHSGGTSGGTSRRHSRSTQVSSPRTKRRSPRAERQRGRRDCRPEAPLLFHTHGGRRANPETADNTSTGPSSPRRQRRQRRKSHPSQDEQYGSHRGPSPPGEIVEPTGTGNRRTSRTFYTVGENGVEMLARTEYDPAEPDESGAEPAENQPAPDENGAPPAENGTGSALQE